LPVTCRERIFSLYTDCHIPFYLHNFLDQLADFSATLADPWAIVRETGITVITHASAIAGPDLWLATDKGTLTKSNIVLARGEAIGNLEDIKFFEQSIVWLERAAATGPPTRFPASIIKVPTLSHVLSIVACVAAESQLCLIG
jgi:hypothetical protein